MKVEENQTFSAYFFFLLGGYDQKTLESFSIIVTLRDTNTPSKCCQNVREFSTPNENLSKRLNLD